MCGGGRPETIVMPDMGAYDRMAQAQIAAMGQAQGGMVAAKQAELNQVLASQQATMSELRDARVQRANATAADSARLAALLGPPPPEKAAAAPTIGADRSGMSRPAGKRGLRIDRASAGGAGTGLNIY